MTEQVEEAGVRVIVVEASPTLRVAPVRALAVLTKARLNSLVAVTVVAGALLAPGGPGWTIVLLASLGAMLAALGACALNQVLERDRDVHMDRTRARPIPSGAVSVHAAAALGLSLMAAGCALALTAGPLPALLTLLGGALYVFVYTPLKPLTPLAFLPGALAGALPPVIGWLAAGGALDGGALALLVLLLAWQVPHVAAIDWVNRDDHTRGGLRTLAVADPSGAATGLVAVLGAAALVLASAAPSLAGLAPAWAGLAAGALSLPLVALAERLRRERTTAAARRLFLATLLQLPCVLLIAIVARGM